MFISNKSRTVSNCFNSHCSDLWNSLTYTASTKSINYPTEKTTVDSEDWFLSGLTTEGVASNTVSYYNMAHFHVNGDIKILINSMHNLIIPQMSLFGVPCCHFHSGTLFLSNWRSWNSNSRTLQKNDWGHVHNWYKWTILMMCGFVKKQLVIEWNQTLAFYTESFQDRLSPTLEMCHNHPAPPQVIGIILLFFRAQVLQQKFMCLILNPLPQSEVALSWWTQSTTRTNAI
jgi:hypothetical protein